MPGWSFIAAFPASETTTSNPESIVQQKHVQKETENNLYMSSHPRTTRQRFRRPSFLRRRIWIFWQGRPTQRRVQSATSVSGTRRQGLPNGATSADYKHTGSHLRARRERRSRAVCLSSRLFLSILRILDVGHVNLGQPTQLRLAGGLGRHCFMRVGRAGRPSDKSFTD